MDLTQGSIELIAGQQYWIVETAAFPEDQDVWNNNTVGATGLVASTAGYPYDPLNWTVGGPGLLPAFDVLGTPVSSVPEPPSLFLMVAILAAVGLSNRLGTSLNRWRPKARRGWR